MENYLAIVVSTALVDNVLLIKLFGLGPLFGGARRLESALCIGLTTAFCLSVVTGISYLINEYVLVKYEVEFLRVLIYLTLIVACWKMSDAYLSRTNPILKNSLGLYFPLASINSASLGVPLLLTQEQVNFGESIFYGLGHAIGFTFMLVIISSLRERLEVADVPRAFRGTAILLVTVGMISLTFLGFIGLIK